MGGVGDDGKKKKGKKCRKKRGLIEVAKRGGNEHVQSSLPTRHVVIARGVETERKRKKRKEKKNKKQTNKQTNKNARKKESQKKMRREKGEREGEKRGMKDATKNECKVGRAN